MIYRRLFWIPAMLVAGVGFGQTPSRATATLVNATGVEVGRATIVPTETGTAVQITATLTNLPPGTHALHVHTVGKCDPPAFTSAGGHFNPTGKQHGKDNPNVALIHALKRHNKRYGLASLCLGGGNAVAMIVERV